MIKVFVIGWALLCDLPDVTVRPWILLYAAGTCTRGGDTYCDAVAAVTRWDPLRSNSVKRRSNAPRR